MLTAVKSQRQLAEFIGISHQKLGRWLKEGQPSGVKQIPSDEFTVNGINAVFSQYQEVVKLRAQKDGLPFDSRIPVYAERKPLRDGSPGDRVIAENTHFLSDRLRHSFMALSQFSQKYLAVSVRSVINLAVYNNRAEAVNQTHKRTDAQKLYRAELRHALKQGITKKAIYTKMEDIRGFTDIHRVIANVDKKLRQKHEPATGEPGTKLADAILLQLMPTKKPANAKRKKSVKGRTH